MGRRFCPRHSWPHICPTRRSERTSWPTAPRSPLSDLTAAPRASASTRSSSAEAWRDPLAARVLSDSYDRVTVLDRDRLPEGVTENRRAVPQGRHAHGLQLGGQVALEELLPGLCEETKEAGAPALLPGVEMRFALFGSELVRTAVGSDGSVASRPLIEGVVRRRVRAIENVTVRDLRGVVDCSAPTAASPACAPRTVRRAASRSTCARTSSSLPPDAAARCRSGWTQLGYEAPAEERVDVDLMYVSRNLRIRPGALGDDKIVLNAAYPGRPRGVAMLADENGTWNVTLYGYGDDHRPPTDPEGFNAFAATVTDPDVAAAIATPSRPTTSPRTATRRACAAATTSCAASRRACSSWATRCAASTRSTVRA